MLKFLTHKLRTQSINEDNCTQKADENHDSGTESDEDIDYPDLSPTVMSNRMCSISPADTGCSLESLALDHQDSHSSEEELEVINSQKEPQFSYLNRAASVCLSEKRKWSEINDPVSHWHSPENAENMPRYGNLDVQSPSNRFCCDDGLNIEHAASSDDEAHNITDMETPVQFRTSPPVEAVKPRQRFLLNKGRSLSPPAKLVHYESSPRKRTRHTRHIHMQRPYLDFEKMQQLKTRSVTTWKHPEEHSGELSVYCW